MHVRSIMFRPFLFFLASIASESLSASALAKDDELPIRYIAKFISEEAYESFFEIKSFHLVVEELGLNSMVLEFDSEEEAQEWALLRDDVEYVEKDQFVSLPQGEETFPVETSMSGETIPYGIKMVNALDIPDYVDGSDVTVCIVDTGYTFGHEDLPNNDLVTGAFINGTLQKPFDDDEDWFEDEIGHGTHVAGTIAAIGDNNKGIVGVLNSNNMRLHIAHLGEDDRASGLSTALQTNCPKDGPTVINLSLEIEDFSSVIKDRIEIILNQNDQVLFVAAAGNDGTSDYKFPASYPGVMSVAAVDENKKRSSSSQYNDQVDISAPGVMILSTANETQKYEYRSGTSMATPHVVGVAAKIWSHKPSMTAQEVRELLQMTAEDLGEPGRDDEYGWGLVDASAAYKVVATSATCEDTSAAFLWGGESKDCAWVAYERMDLCEERSFKLACPSTCQACNYKCSNIDMPFSPMLVDYITTDCTRIASLQPDELDEVCSSPLIKSSCRKTCDRCTV